MNTTLILSPRHDARPLAAQMLRRELTRLRPHSP
jgi:hypothetical protein